MGLYGTTKAALDRITSGLGGDLDGTGIRVNAMGPRVAVMSEGFEAMIVDQLPRELFESIEEIVEAVVALCDCPAEVTGQVLESLDLIADWGLTGRSLDWPGAGIAPAPTGDTVRITVEIYSAPQGAGLGRSCRDERRSHHRCRHPPVRTVRGQVGHGDVRRCHRRRRGRCGRGVGRHPRRRRRQLDRGQPRRDRRHGGVVGHPVHQRVQRVRHCGQRRKGVRRRNPSRRLRHRHRRRPGQASTRRVHRGSRPCRHADGGTPRTASTSPRSSSA